MEPPHQAFSEEIRELVTVRTEQLEKMDERWASRFEPAGIAAILRSHGFCDIEDINFQEITSRFARSVQGLAPGQAGLHVAHAKHSHTGTTSASPQNALAAEALGFSLTSWRLGCTMCH